MGSHPLVIRQNENGINEKIQNRPKTFSLITYNNKLNTLFTSGCLILKQVILNYSEE